MEPTNTARDGVSSADLGHARMAREEKERQAKIEQEGASAKPHASSQVSSQPGSETAKEGEAKGEYSNAEKNRQAAKKDTGKPTPGSAKSGK